MTNVARMMVGAALMAVAGVAVAQRVAPAPELAYQLTEGQNVNAFVRDGAVAAHLLLRNGTDPRILVAFPAGESHRRHQPRLCPRCHGSGQGHRSQRQGSLYGRFSACRCDRRGDPQRRLRCRQHGKTVDCQQ